MPAPQVQDDPPGLSRREVFRLLVVAQDYAMTVPESIELVCQRFGLSESQVRCIEQEGLEGCWPPWGLTERPAGRALSGRACFFPPGEEAHTPPRDTCPG
jgi:hypothetical protein